MRPVAATNRTACDSRSSMKKISEWRSSGRIAFALPLLVDAREPATRFVGYVAVFSNAVSTATIPIPFLSILGQGLIAWYGAEHSVILAGLIGGTAMSVGQIPNYAVGAVSMPAVESRIAQRPRLHRRVLAIVADVERRGWVTVFLLSFVPNPFTTFGDMAAGYSGMRFRTFYLAVWSARIIRALIIAFLGQAFLDALFME
jgi:membrane protein DedA with SNARE-associated domain